VGLRRGTATKTLHGFPGTIPGSDRPRKLGNELPMHVDGGQFYNGGWWHGDVKGLYLTDKRNEISPNVDDNQNYC